MRLSSGLAALLIVPALAGCGTVFQPAEGPEAPEGTPVDAAIVAENWAAVEACVGVAAEPPRVLWNTEAYIREQTDLATANAYYSFSAATVVVPPDLRAMHHEMIHHLLRAAGVSHDDNLHHQHPAFLDCGYSFTILPPGTVTPAGQTYPEGRSADGGPY